MSREWSIGAIANFIFTPQEHAVIHGVTHEHPLVLSFSDLSVWCYVCDSYVHHETLHSVKAAAHKMKFGYEPPSS